MSNKPIQRISNLKFSRILKRNKTISQINVTPMVDVMLVLLVIFIGLFYIDIPSPSRLIKESYHLEVK